MADNKNFSGPAKKVINPENKDDLPPVESAVETKETPARTPEKEKVIEQLPEKKAEVLAAVEGAKAPEYQGGITATPVSQKYLARQKRIESILEQDLEEIFLGLPAIKQREFKTAGEQTAKEINSLLEQAKAKVNRILDLIKKWLVLIPGVNKFFIEQEAKIKTDEILKLKEAKD